MYVQLKLFKIINYNFMHFSIMNQQTEQQDATVAMEYTAYFFHNTLH